MTSVGSTASVVSVGVVGLGYWGPNLARNFDRLPEAELRWICDASQERRERCAPVSWTSCSATRRWTP